MIPVIILAAFVLLLVVAAVRDVVSFTIPNWISVALALVFLPAVLAAGLGWQAIGLHLAAGAIFLLIGMALFALGWVGGGDAKLAAAVALWMGWPDTLLYIAVVGLAGGAFTLVLLAARRALGPVMQGFGISAPILERTGDIPYGVAIAGAALLLLTRAGLPAALAATIS